MPLPALAAKDKSDTLKARNGPVRLSAERTMVIQLRRLTGTFYAVKAPDFTMQQGHEERTDRDDQAFRQGQTCSSFIPWIISRRENSFIPEDFYTAKPCRIGYIRGQNGRTRRDLRFLKARNFVKN